MLAFVPVTLDLYRTVKRHLHWTLQNLVAFADTDAAGRFVIRRLPPTERYFAAVVASLEDGDQFDPELLERLREHATGFTLGEGERKALNLSQ